MVHMRCQHLHSRVRQTVNQRILQQWRAFLLSQNCQIRQASNLVERPKKVSLNFIDKINSEILQQQKMKQTSKKRIPVHVSHKVDKQIVTPITFTIQSLLQKGELENAWKFAEKSAAQLLEQNIPRLTIQMLLNSLYDQVHINMARLALNSRKLEFLYFTRLELLAGIIRNSQGRLHWDKKELGIVIELYGKLDQVQRAESIFRNMSDYTLQLQPSVEVYNKLLAVYIRRFKHVDDMTKKRFFSKMKTLEVEMIKKQLKPDTTSYNLLLAAKVKLHDLQGAEKIYSRMTTLPDRVTYNILLNGYLKNCRNNKDREVTNTWMERLLDSGIVPNRKTFNSVMDGLSLQIIHYARTMETNELNSAVKSVSSLYKVMLQLGHKPDTEIVNTLLKCYTAAKDHDHVETIMGIIQFPEKKSSGCGNCGCGSSSTSTSSSDSINQGVVGKTKRVLKVKPDTYTFNILIKHYLANNKPDQAFQMYDSMMTLGLDPDTVTYADFIWYYANQGNVKECLRYVEVMQKKGIPYNTYIYNTLLNCSFNFPKEAYLITPHLRTVLASRQGSIDNVSHNIVLSRSKLGGEINADASFEKFTELLDQNVFSNITSEGGIPNTRTYNTILESTGKFYKPSTNKMMKNSNEMGITLDSIIASLDTTHLKPDIYTFALNIRNATYRGDMIKAEMVFKNMTDAGIKPNLFVFSHLIYGYATIGKVDRAQDILQRMTLPPYNITPNAITYAPLIKGYAETAEYEKAYEVFREMLDKNINADLVIYTILASVFLNSPARGNERRAIDLLEGISKAGVPMDAASSTMLMKAYATEAASILESAATVTNGHKKPVAERIANHVEKINKIYTTLRKNNLLDSKSITTVLQSYNQMQKPEGAWKLWSELKKDETIVPSIYYYNTLIHGLSQAKTWYPMIKLVFQEMMQDARVQPDSSTFDLIIWSAYSVVDYESVRNIWNSNDRKALDNSAYLVRTYFAVMTALLDKHDVEGAKGAYEAFKGLASKPNSTTVWAHKIDSLASQLGYKTQQNYPPVI